MVMKMMMMMMPHFLPHSAQRAQRERKFEPALAIAMPLLARDHFFCSPQMKIKNSGQARLRTHSHSPFTEIFYKNGWQGDGPVLGSC